MGFGNRNNSRISSHNSRIRRIRNSVLNNRINPNRCRVTTPVSCCRLSSRMNSRHRRKCSR